MTGPDFEQQMRGEILRAFSLKPWHIGLAPVPWHIRAWHKLTVGRLRVKLARWRERRREPGWED